MITRQVFPTILDYVKLCSTPIALECRLLIKTFSLVIHNVVDRNLPLNDIHRLKFSAVCQFTPVQTQTFIRRGYKFTIIVLTPINGLVTPKLNLSTLLFLHLSPLITPVQPLSAMIHLHSEIYVTLYAPLLISFIAPILLRPVAVHLKLYHHMNYNKFNNFSPNLFPVFVNKKIVTNNNDPDNEFLIVNVAHLLVIDALNQGVRPQSVHALFARRLAMSSHMSNRRLHLRKFVPIFIKQHVMSPLMFNFLEVNPVQSYNPNRFCPLFVIAIVQ